MTFEDKITGITKFTPLEIITYSHKQYPSVYLFWFSVGLVLIAFAYMYINTRAPRVVRKWNLARNLADE